MPVRLRLHAHAVALACLLTLAWTLSDWAALSALRLPDTDDAMRLQQVRDWIAGQGFFDLAQHRLADGLIMHWSRIGDLVLAAIIVALRPFAGQPAAEIAAVIVWPLIQFAAYLMLVQSITRRLLPAAGSTGLVLAALAYPASALFLPGRIDHHALQLILVLVQVRALLAPPTWRSGAVIGSALAIGSTIGLETLPFAIVTGATIVAGWLRGSGGERQAGFGLALALIILVLLPLAGQGQDCDTIRPLALPAAIGGVALALLGWIDRWRWASLGVFAIAALMLIRPVASLCLSGPYGGVDPMVARLWLANVAEAQPLFESPFVHAIGYAGLLTIGIAASGWLAWRRGGDWWVLLAYQVAALALAIVQLRGAYLGAALGVVPIAVLLTEARAAKRLGAVLGLWIAGTGLIYPMIGSAYAAGSTDGNMMPAPSCTSPDALDRLATLKPGRVMAAIDLGAYAIASTRHTLIAAPYHRNNAGNAAMYRFFLSDPAEALRIARRWRVDYVVVCPGDFAEVGPPAGSIAAGARLGWLVRQGNRVPAIYTISPRLPADESTR